MLHVALVYRSGGQYVVEHVSRLVKQIKTHLAQPYRISCLTDRPHDLNGIGLNAVIPLRHDYPGWWSKIELYRPDLFQDAPFVYFDLDTTIVRGINYLHNVKQGPVFVDDFYTPERLGTGLQYFKPHARVQELYTKFIANAETYMKRYTVYKDPGLGDQAFVMKNLPFGYTTFEKLYPGSVVSYKLHCQSGVPSNASIICFHGNPKPWDINLMV